MNTEFVQDLITACRGDPEHFKTLLASKALADILQVLVNRIEHLEKGVARAQQAVVPGQFMDIPLGTSPQQWQQALLRQFQAAQQDRAELMERQATRFYLPSKT